jgi:hypothetical protein
MLPAPTTKSLVIRRAASERPAGNSSPFLVVRGRRAFFATVLLTWISSRHDFVGYHKVIDESACLPDPNGFYLAGGSFLEKSGREEGQGRACL